MKEIVAVLHNIRSIHNVGSIFRTADGAGISKLYLSGITPSPYDRFGKLLPQFSKVALGAEKTVQWEKEKSTARILTKLKKEGYALLAVEQAKNSIFYFKYKPVGGKLAVVIGNEVHGISPALLKKMDKVLEIPMKGGKESLNVSVAFGIVAYYFVEHAGI